jgi:cytochrome c
VLGGVGAVLAAAGVAALLVIRAYSISPSDVTRPAGTKPFAAETAKLLELGTARHGDVTLSTNGRSCNTCHLEEDSYNPTFNKPYAHYVQSVKLKTGLDEITAEGMVQFCMISAMNAKPLPWDSETLAALTAFVLERNKKAVGR